VSAEGHNASKLMHKFPAKTRKTGYFYMLTVFFSAGTRAWRDGKFFT